MYACDVCMYHTCHVCMTYAYMVYTRRSTSTYTIPMEVCTLFIQASTKHQHDTTRVKLIGICLPPLPLLIRTYQLTTRGGGGLNRMPLKIPMILAPRARRAGRADTMLFLRVSFVSFFYVLIL